MSALVTALVGLVGIVIGGLIQWILTERSKRKWLIFSKKEEAYSLMIKNIRGFYTQSLSTHQMMEFLNQLNLLWLFAPDQVIKKAYNFLETIHAQQPCSDKEKEAALGEFMAALRKDLSTNKIMKKTQLSALDFKHLTANK